MRVRKLHRWKVTPARARQIQMELRRRVIRADRLPAVRRVAGADVAFDLRRGRAIAGVILYSFPELRELERVWVERRLEFPYVPAPVVTHDIIIEAPEDRVWERLGGARTSC